MVGSTIQIIMNHLSKNASVIATFTSLALVTNYLMLGIPNVKLMDLLVFIAGLNFGAPVGVSVGVLTWCVYGVINPYGFSLPILLVTALSETLYGLAGGFLSRNLKLSNPLTKWEYLSFSVKLGVLGFILTFIYDLLTNIVFSMVFCVPLLIALVAGIPFTILHELSNTLLFALLGPPSLIMLRKLGRR